MAAATNQLTKVQQTVLDLLANKLFSANRDIDYSDMSAVYDESEQQAVHVITFSDISQVEDDALRQKIQRRIAVTLTNNARINSEHVELNNVLKENNIPYVTFKGCASASYYPEPILRVMGDVDFLVDKKNVQSVSEILEEYGFYHPRGIHPTEKAYCRDNGGLTTSLWELHWGINGVPEGKIGDKIREYLADIYDCAVEINTADGSYMAVNTFHHGLIMLVHCAMHMVGSGIGLRHLCDWAVYVSRFSDEEFCEMFEEKLKSVGLWNLAKLLTQLSVHYLSCPAKAFAGEADEKLLSEIMADMFVGGNFGRKDPIRSESGSLITNQGRGVVDNTNILLQAFYTANEIVRNRWKLAKKLVILYPIGWVYWGVRYLILSAIGKRKKLHIKKMVSDAGERKKIYKQLNLFESE